MGHSAVVHIGVYAHPIERMDGKRYDGLDALIGAARGELAGLVFPVSSPQSR